MKKKILIGSILVVLMLLILSSMPITAISIENNFNTLSRDTFYVDDEGDGDYKTIQEAINAANESDTIIVYSGKYVENVIIDKQVNLIGYSIELGNGTDTGKPIVDGDNKGDVIDIIADRVYISGFKITNSAGLGLTTRTYKGINIGSDFNIITENVITKNNCHGIALKNGSNNTITNNIISHNKVCGYAQFRYSINNTIVGNTFIRNGIGISPTSGIKPDMENDSDFTVFEFWDTLTIENNTVNGKPIYYFQNKSNFIVPLDAGQVILAGCKDAKISGLKINNTDNGIIVWGCSNINISNNVVVNNIGSGIKLSNSSHCQISNNVIKRNWAGIDLRYKSCDNLIKYNDIRYNNNRMIPKYLSWQAGIFIKYCSRRNVVVKNNLINPRIRANAFDYSDDNKWSRNYWNRPRLLPKPVFYMTTNGSTAIPRLKTIDWHPAKQPFDI